MVIPTISASWLVLSSDIARSLAHLASDVFDASGEESDRLNGSRLSHYYEMTFSLGLFHWDVGVAV